MSSNWTPPTIDSSILFVKRSIAGDPFGVPAEEGFIISALEALNEIMAIPEMTSCPIEGCENKYEGGEVSGGNMMRDKVRKIVEAIR